jgi:hypothetical protein
MEIRLIALLSTGEQRKLRDYESPSETVKSDWYRHAHHRVLHR